MNLVALIEFLRNRLKAVIWISFGILALLILADALFVDKEHAHTRLEHVPAFWSVFGFVACALIVLVSKWYGHLGIMTRENYYDQPEPEGKEQEVAHHE